MPLETPTAKATAAMAAVLVMQREVITRAFGVRGAAVDPLYEAMNAGSPRDTVCVTTIGPSPCIECGQAGPLGVPVMVVVVVVVDATLDEVANSTLGTEIGHVNGFVDSDGRHPTRHPGVDGPWVPKEPRPGPSG